MAHALEIQNAPRRPFEPDSLGSLPASARSGSGNVLIELSDSKMFRSAILEMQVELHQVLLLVNGPKKKDLAVDATATLEA